MSRDVREIFGRRAAYYTTSANHKDDAVLERLIALARPRPGMTALDVATETGHTALALAPHVQHVAAVEGETYTNHWFVIAAAVKARA